MKRGDRVKVIDADPATLRVGKGRKPPFKLGAYLTVRGVQGSGPGASVELEGFRGYWAAARFEPVEG